MPTQARKKESSRTQSEVVAQPNQITAMIHFLGTKNKTIVGAGHSEPGIPVAEKKNKKNCIAALGPTEYPPPSHTPCIINNRSISLTLINLQLYSACPFSQSKNLSFCSSVLSRSLHQWVSLITKGSAAYPNSCATPLPCTHGERGRTRLPR